jgi:hypothetical protein
MKTGSSKTFPTAVTIFLAFISGLSTLMVSRSFNRSVLAKNEVAILESQTANQWNYYSEKSIRLDIQRLADTFHKSLRKDQKPEQAFQILESKRAEIQAEARTLEARRDDRNAYSEKMGKIAQLFGSALALLQIAVLLISLCSLQPNQAALRGGLFAGCAGLSMFLYGLFEFLRSSS